MSQNELFFLVNIQSDSLPSISVPFNVSNSFGSVRLDSLGALGIWVSEDVRGGAPGLEDEDCSSALCFATTAYNNQLLLLCHIKILFVVDKVNSMINDMILLQ